MGNDQSGYQSALADRAAAARSTGAIPRVRTRQDSSLSFQDESGRSSPHPSDGSGGADVPYVSYTVNKPIGESPKHQGKGPGGKQGRVGGPIYAPAKPVKGRNVVVVSQKSMMNDGEEDSEIALLQRIPLFLPIIRSSLSTTHPREPDIVDRLDSAALQRIVALLEEFMKQNSELVASDQAKLVQRVKEIDSQLAVIMSALTDRQKMYARYADKLSRVHEVSHALSRTQLSLTTALDSIETLNRQLPESERLEPLMAWSTG